MALTLRAKTGNAYTDPIISRRARTLTWSTGGRPYHRDVSTEATVPAAEAECKRLSNFAQTLTLTFSGRVVPPAYATPELAGPRSWPVLEDMTGQ